MPVSITATNFRTVYNSPTPVLRELLPQVFEQLKSPTVGRRFLESYVGCMTDKWGKDSSPRGSERWSAFEETCFECGAVEALITVARNDRHDLHIPVYSAMNGLTRLSRGGSREQRLEMREQVIQHRLLDLCVERIRDASLVLHKCAALNVIRAMCADLFLGETMSAADAADLICLLCDAALEGPDRTCRELYDPATTWQSQMMLGRVGISPQVAGKYGNRWYGVSQENSLYAVHFLLLRHPLPSPQFRLDILKHRPEMIDKLMDCVAQPRRPCYPENNFDMAAVESLFLLFQFPLDSIPGLDIPLEGAMKKERDEEWKASKAALEILYSRPDWLSRFLSIWKRFDDETYTRVQRMLERTVAEWHAPMEPEEDEIHTLWEYRAHIRITTLRLIIGVTYVDSVKDTDLLSLLRIAYLACAKTPSPDATSMRTLCDYAERADEIFRVPQWVSDIAPDTIDAPCQVAGEPVTGPTALLRLLIILARRGILDQAQGWTSLPEGVDPSASLTQVKQILSPAVLDKVLPLALKRVAARRELGNTRMRKSDWWHARSAYRPAAELAVCLIDFDKATNGRWSSKVQGATKELVSSLGNAAEMSNRKKEWATALGFALAADEIGLHALSSEDITQTILEKNQRRIDLARSKLRRA